MLVGSLSQTRTQEEPGVDNVDKEGKELREAEGLDSVCREVKFLGSGCLLSQVVGWEIHLISVFQEALLLIQSIILIHSISIHRPREGLERGLRG